MSDTIVVRGTETTTSPAHLALYLLECFSASDFVSEYGPLYLFLEMTIP